MQQTQQSSSQQSHPQNQTGTGFFPPYQTPRSQPQPLQAAPPTSAPRAPASTSSTLPRLNTVDMQIQPPPPGPLPIQHNLPQGQTPQQQDPQSSPSIHFHHWIPPTSQNPSKDPPTPSSKSTHESPYSQNAASHLRSEYQNSPKKRKTTDTQQAGPSKVPNTSPSFSQTSSGSTSGRRRGHSRQRSDASSRVGHEHTGPTRPRGRTESGRQSVSEAESGSQRHNSLQPETRHQTSRHAASEMRHLSRDPVVNDERSRNNSPKREPEPQS